MEFLQWLYGYAIKITPNIGETYNGYERRLNAYCKQKGSNAIIILVQNANDHGISMNAHLIPNKAHIKRGGEGDETNNGENQISIEEIKGDSNEMSKVKIKLIDNQRRKQLINLIASLESEMTDQLKNHKIFLEDIDRKSVV